MAIRARRSSDVATRRARWSRSSTPATNCCQRRRSPRKCASDTGWSDQIGRVKPRRKNGAETTHSATTENAKRRNCTAARLRRFSRVRRQARNRIVRRIGHVLSIPAKDGCARTWHAAAAPPRLRTTFTGGRRRIRICDHGLLLGVRLGGGNEKRALWPVVDYGLARRLPSERNDIHLRRRLQLHDGSGRGHWLHHDVLRQLRSDREQCSVVVIHGK